MRSFNGELAVCSHHSCCMAAGPGPVMSCNLCDDFRCEIFLGMVEEVVPNSSVIRITTWPSGIIWNLDVLITYQSCISKREAEGEEDEEEEFTNNNKSQHWQHIPDDQQPEQHQHRNKQRHCLDIPCPLVFQGTWVCWNWLDWSSSPFEVPNSQNYMLLPTLCPSLYPKYKPPPPRYSVLAGHPPPQKKNREWLLLQKLVGKIVLEPCKVHSSGDHFGIVVYMLSENVVFFGKGACYLLGGCGCWELVERQRCPTRSILQCQHQLNGGGHGKRPGAARRWFGHVWYMSDLPPIQDASGKERCIGTYRDCLNVILVVTLSWCPVNPRKMFLNC